MDVQPVEYRRDGYRISTDPHDLDIDVIYHFLAYDSYWARNIPPEVVQKSVRNSLCFGLYTDSSDTGRAVQVGFARVMTDCATFAYLADVFVLPEFRGRGLGKWLVECVLAHPELQNLRSFMLGTSDAHGLYAGFGFKPLARPENYMQKRVENPYGQTPDAETAAG